MRQNERGWPDSFPAHRLAVDRIERKGCWGDDSFCTPTRQQGLLGDDQGNLEEPGSEFAGHEDALRFWIVGDAIEDSSRGALARRQQSR